MPAATQASTAPVDTSGSSHSSARPGTTDTSSTTSRASFGSEETRSITASRTLPGTRPGGAARASVTKNGLPPVTACSPAASRSAWRASASTAGAENGAGSIRSSAARGEGAERPAHLGPVGERVGAAGEDQAAARGGEPAREQRQQVERGVVGPVDVLDDDRGRAAGAERLQQRVEHRLARAALQRAGERPGGRAGDVVDRAERTRDAERVARAVERAHLARAEHGADQRGLADPGLAQHEHDPALGPGPVQCAPEGGLLLLALKQLHDPVHRPYPGARRT